MKFIVKDIKSISKQELEEVYNKMYAIQENLETLEDYSNNGVHPCNIDNVNNITIDLFCANDEFTVEGYFENGSKHYTESPYSNNNFLEIEVVSYKVAVSNDMDFLDDEETGYTLGGELSMYKPLGNSEYWYRLL